MVTDKGRAIAIIQFRLRFVDDNDALLEYLVLRYVRLHSCSCGYLILGQIGVGVS